jgi:hypothetical protein
VRIAARVEPAPHDQFAWQLIGSHGDRFYLDGLIGIAENTDTQQRARSVVITECLPEDIPSTDQIGPSGRSHIDRRRHEVGQVSPAAPRAATRFAIACRACAATSPTETVFPSLSRGHVPAVNTVPPGPVTAAYAYGTWLSVRPGERTECSRVKA